MKFFRQGVLPIAILLAIIGGVTYVTHYTGKPPSSPTSNRFPNGDPAEEHLVFPLASVVWDDLDPKKTAEFEWNVRDNYDFWFQNPHAGSVQVGMKAKSPSCVGVAVGLLPPGAGKELWQQGPVAAGALVLFGSEGVPNVLGPFVQTVHGLQQAVNRVAQWQDLSAEGKVATVPAAHPEHGPTVGLVRLSWKGQKLGPERVGAQLWTQRDESKRLERLLDLPVYFVPALRVDPWKLRLADLTTAGHEDTVRFWCWSATRTELKLRVREEQDSPFFTCRVQPLTEEQQQNLELGQKTRVRCGYQVQVTVQERQAAQRMDLGQFQNRIVLTAEGTQDEVVVLVGGVVRGEVKILTPAAKDQIDLDSFPASRGTTQTVTLAADRPGITVTLKDWPKRFLDVTPLESKPAVDGQPRWELQLRVPPGRFTGPLPPGAEVILLMMEGPSERRLRIPVVGQATQ